MIVASQRHTLLPFDDCLYVLQLQIQHLMRLSGVSVCTTPTF